MHVPIEILGSFFPHLLSIFLRMLLLSSFGAITALASPTNKHTSTKTQILARDQSDYPSDQDIANNCNVVAGKSVFFSQTGDSTLAYKFAKENEKMIVRQAFPPKYTVKNGRSDKWYQDFCDRLSRIFAEKSTGIVHFIGPWDTKINPCRVWKRVEYNALVNNDAVTKIVQVNLHDFSQKTDLWVSDTSSVATYKARRDLHNPLTSRATSTCFDWDGTGEDPADSDASSTTSAPTSGWCGIHVTQYQKPNPATDNYKVDVSIYDDNGALIGRVAGADAPGGERVYVISTLPDVLSITLGKVDADVVLFNYGTDAWGSKAQDHYCSFGGYGGGNRNGDCGFTC